MTENSFETLRHVNLLQCASHNQLVQWSKKLVKEAFEELMHTRFVKATAKVKGKYDFKTSDPTPMEVQVIIAISKRFGKKEKKIEALRNGTHFGCDGIFIKRYKKELVGWKSHVYIRLNREDRREDTSEDQ
ncbi:hypothetical protein OSTOST_24299 [Ostertagia ostertagi]